MAQNDTVRRFSIVQQYMQNQSPDQWRRLQRQAMASLVNDGDWASLPSILSHAAEHYRKTMHSQGIGYDPGMAGEIWGYLANILDRAAKDCENALKRCDLTIRETT